MQIFSSGASSRSTPQLPLSYQRPKPTFTPPPNRLAARCRVGPIGKGPLIAGLATLFFAQMALAVTPNFVQSNSLAPSTPQLQIAIPFRSTQTVGNLNVVVVGWNDSSATVSSVADSKGNVYTLAVGPTVLTGTVSLSQSVYYAKNIAAAAAGANSLTVSFNKAAVSSDVRIMEYSGIDPANPVDVVVNATGNSSTSSSGAVTTKNATDMLVGANVGWTATGGPGSGFIRRMITSAGDIAEDRVVTATGSYSATASLMSAGPWVMQMVAFRAAGSATPALPSSGFVQGNFLDTGTAAATSQPVAFTSSEASGNFNVVAVNCSTGITILKVVDSQGNAYSLAAGPLANSSEGSVVSLYVAPNVKAGANTVTVSFSGGTWNEIQIAEYAGITGVDISAIKSGVGTAPSSGAATTTFANDILVSYVELAAAGSPTAGTGSTKRITPSWNAGLEDQRVSAIGSYAGTWSEVGGTNWITAMVALKTNLASPTPTPTGSPSATPTPTGSPSATPKPTVSPTPVATPTPSATPKPTVSPTPTATPTPIGTPIATPTPTSSISLGWNANVVNPSGYVVHIGPSSGNYTQTQNMGDATAGSVGQLKSGSTYYFVITAYDAAGNQSLNSNEVSAKAP